MWITLENTKTHRLEDGKVKTVDSNSFSSSFCTRKGFSAKKMKKSAVYFDRRTQIIRNRCPNLAGRIRRSMGRASMPLFCDIALKDREVRVVCTGERRISVPTNPDPVAGSANTARPLPSQWRPWFRFMRNAPTRPGLPSKCRDKSQPVPPTDRSGRRRFSSPDVPERCCMSFRYAGYGNPHRSFRLQTGHRSTHSYQ
ncbi:hypothetical protein RUE5091_02718 [Ruegeria denitrificans]|uniref:Uncharacterized protein n=1 Tax=Ruegeria denitrificans TaxID=1715692 RepID=A0A0P1ICM9_9RHOB|nr:hypothetical protein RUE5091_02718 [Ruegeria denitrificans]